LSATATSGGTNLMASAACSYWSGGLQVATGSNVNIGVYGMVGSTTYPPACYKYGSGFSVGVSIVTFAMMIVLAMFMF